MHEAPGAQADVPPPPASPLLPIAGAYTLGVAAGVTLGGAWLWLAAAGLATTLALRRGPARTSRAAMLLLLALAGASYAAARTHHLARHDIRAFVTQDPQIAAVRGVIDSPVRIAAAQGGAMAQFSYEPPNTLTTLRLESLCVAGAWQRSTGRVLLVVREADLKLSRGQRLQATGWLSDIDPPRNPGERDYRKLSMDQGVYGRLTLASVRNYRVLEESGARSALEQVRGWTARSARDALRLGLDHDARSLAMLDLLLLGGQPPGATELYRSFQRVGLAHALAISGAHLTILAGLVFLAARCVTPHPPRAALAVLAVLLLYLLAVPARPPILRAGIMAGVFCAGYLMGRRFRAMDLLGLSLLLVLLWRPMDVRDAGLQLSFGVVAALLRFTEPVSRWLWRDPPTILLAATPRHRAARHLADFMAANLVGFLAALPLVAYHFQIISPLTVVLSLAALPIMSLILALGYLKVLLGVVLPSAGVLLACPLRALSWASIALVEQAGRWPGAAVPLRQPPSLAWTLAALATVLALLAGRFHGRRIALTLTLLLCALWLTLTQRTGDPPGTPLRLNMFAVGDGSCFLLRTTPARGEPYTLMFDCGSQAYLDVGKASIAPALRRLGVEHIDALLLSHADIDHYCGALDLAERVSIGRVLATPHLLTEARQNPESPTAFLVQGLRNRGVALEAAWRGWRWQREGVEAELLWPPPLDEFDPPRANDSSMVLSVRVAGRRILLTGDVQQLAMTELLRLDTRGELGPLGLRADVTDLPHHGSFDDASPQWLARVQPVAVLQSSGPYRLFEDRWAPLLSEARVARWTTEQSGMVELSVAQDGALRWRSFKPIEGQSR